MVMKKKDVDYFKNLLTEQLDELLSQADDTVTGMTAPKENFPRSDRPRLARGRSQLHASHSRPRKQVDQKNQKSFRTNRRWHLWDL